MAGICEYDDPPDFEELHTRATARLRKLKLEYTIGRDIDEFYFFTIYQVPLAEDHPLWTCTQLKRSDIRQGCLYVRIDETHRLWPAKPGAEPLPPAPICRHRHGTGVCDPSPFDDSAWPRKVP